MDKVAFLSACVLFASMIPLAPAAAILPHKNTLDWKHLISKRATEPVVPTENKPNTENKTENASENNSGNADKDDDSLISDVLESHQQMFDNMAADEGSNSDRSVDWQQLDGESRQLADEMIERRRRRSVAAKRVSTQLARSRRESRTEGRLRLKRYTFADDDEDDVDSFDRIQEQGASEQDLQNLAHYIYQLQKLNEEEQRVDTDFAPTDDRALYGRPEPSRMDENEQLALLGNFIDDQSRIVDDDDDSNDERYKRAYYQDIINEDNEDDGYEEPSVDDLYGESASYPLDDTLDVDESNWSPDERMSPEEEQKLEMLERRIAALADYINSRPRRVYRK